MAASMYRFVCCTAFLLHSILLCVDSTLKEPSLVLVQEMDYSEFSEISPFLVHHRHVRSIHSNQRIKRDVRRDSFEISVFENQTGKIYDVASKIPGVQRNYLLVSSSVNGLFQLTNSGKLNLVAKKKLNFEDDAHRTITVRLNATNTNNSTDVVMFTLTIKVADVNDEQPVFKNRPYPYLATVGQTTSSGVKVYELYADDEDSGSNVQYFLESGGEARFKVETRTKFDNALNRDIVIGEIVTDGTGRFEINRTFELVVSARDTNSRPEQRTVATVLVFVGVRIPQFFEDPYKGTVRENNGVGQTLNGELKVEAKSFQKQHITYQLLDKSNIVSSLFSVNAEGTILTRKRLEYESLTTSQRPPVYELTVKATESQTNLENTAKLIIEVLDDNDNAPVFELNQYTETIPENHPLGVPIKEVKAHDADSGVNAELVYTVDNEHFEVETVNRSSEWIGIIKVKKPLDYDRIPSHAYSFEITATDKGSPPRSGVTSVRISVTNVNDEPPEIQITPKIDLSEKAEPPFPVTVISAIDLDKDGVTFFFSPKKTTYEIFEIVPESGLIRTTARVPNTIDVYVLNITAIDDGACCGGSPRLSSEAYFTVEITDVNDNKPSFLKCSSYNSATVLENEPAGTSVITVSATDNDRGENGRVTYSILQGPQQTTKLFNIDENTGKVTTAKSFNREATPFHILTVLGEDKGTPPLEGYCNFRISIGDKNDNPPVFDQISYSTTISRNLPVGRSVQVVRANDADVGVNAEVLYYLVQNPDSQFGIDEDAGIIILNKTIGADKKTFSLTVMAKDKGIPSLNSTVSVFLTVADQSSKPPSWIKDDYDAEPIKIPETSPLSSVVATMKARSNVASSALTFKLINSKGELRPTDPPFSIVSKGDTVNLTVYSPMDYNVKNRYELRLRVTNQGDSPLTADIRPVIELIDTNNEVPVFQGLDPSSGFYPGSVSENMPPGQTVIEVKAYDKDVSPPNNLLTFSLVPIANLSNLFEIKKVDANTAVVTTASTFDREIQKNYFIKVMVKDGTSSTHPGHLPPDTPNSAEATVQVQIKDQNDNNPYFEKSFYTASIKEDAPPQTYVITVSANDPDDAAILTYSISAGNTKNAFKVGARTGRITVGRQLDYETEDHVYHLTLKVYDGIYSNYTSVDINITDVNDNAPVFVEDPIIISDVVEEDPDITSSNPRLLAMVSATDADKDRPNNMRYSLLGYGTSPPNIIFQIEAETGKLFLLAKLDRDLPNGRSNYQFNIRAQDEDNDPMFGYASVQVKPIDINDNKPDFTSSPEGSVAEHSKFGSSVMTVVAIDYDEGRNGSVIYQLIEGPSEGGQMKFKINENTGLITTNTDTNGLDREETPEYTVKIVASDKGVKPQTKEASVTIKLTDINDQVPKFGRKIYQVTVSEKQASGEIVRVMATDNDIGDNANLEYTLINYFFKVNTVNNEGSIVVSQPVDYEQPDQRFFNLTVIVQDPNPSHKDTAYVEVTVEDFNDNAPEFTPPSITTSIYENAEVDTLVASFSAFDKDSGVNAKFVYSIDRKTDPRRQFAVDQLGNVTIRKMLDRETDEEHRVHILAIDKGDPAQTGTGSLIVIVKDINDNFPIFAEDYRPVVMENREDFGELVIKVKAKDKDADPFGAPFGFKSPVCKDGGSATRCPCLGRPTCEFFSLTFDSNGDEGKGTGLVRTKSVFDREKQKFYEMPIVMWDMRGKSSPHSQTGTNTLTIEIGDLNDNHHSPGHKDIFVYDYKGMFGPMEIGNVYATDPDDWDVVDKTFMYTGPEYMKKYFSIDKDSGMITMAKGVPGSTEPYTFTAKVTDHRWKEEVESTVSVTIRDLTEEAAFSSGAVRLSGISAEDFVDRPKDPKGEITDYKESKYMKFRALLAEKIKVPVENVDILSVMNNNKFTDIRYSAHGSPYYSPGKTNAIVALNKAEFEKNVGIKIEMVPIDECLDEKFEGGCYNFLNVTGKPRMVNTNGTSFVGLETYVTAKEGCRSDTFPNSPNCSPTYCYNGGTCKKDDWGELKCDCPSGPGYDGPRCQGTHHSFDGNSYALYEPLEQCLEGVTSLHIITKQENSLILYNGPTAELPPDVPTDFISLELVGGYPRLRIDHGTGELNLYVDGRDKNLIAKMQKLSDGKWHRIDIIRKGRDVEMIVDYCKTAEIKNEVVVDDSMCRKAGETKEENIFLNVNTMLQLGGRFSTPSYPSNLTNTKFDGCIKNLMHNRKLYDLTIGGTPGYPSGENGCKREDKICRPGSPPAPVCGVNGICTAELGPPPTYTCICKPGFRGNKCSALTTIKDLKEQSYIEWRLRDKFFGGIGPRYLQLKIMFRTRDEDGVLLTVASPSKNKIMTLQILKGKLTVGYNFVGKAKSLALDNKEVSNGQWHVAEVQRYGKAVLLMLDNGEGRNYNYDMGNIGDKEEFIIGNDVFAGASVSFSSGFSQIDSDLSNSCLQDIRMENKWFPMSANENDLSDAAKVTKNANIRDDCIRDDCASNPCPPSRVCYPLWGKYECRCPPHYEEINAKCVSIDYCKNHRCFDDATCEIDHKEEKGYKCICPPGWGEEFCNTMVPARQVAGLTAGAIVAITVCIFILLVLALAVILLVRFGQRNKDGDKYILEVDPEDDIRENVINYDEEGAGEEDQQGYDISRLRKPEDADSLYKPPLENERMPRHDMLRRNAPGHGESPDVGDFIEDRLGSADDDSGAPPYDSVREFAYEGADSDAGSLSSLNTTTSSGSQDYDYLNDWGPKFAKLADMYGAGLEAEED